MFRRAHDGASTLVFPSRALWLGAVLVGAVAALVPACSSEVSTLDRACPCESGWTCCDPDHICVPPGAVCGPASDAAADNQCPAGILLGTDALPALSPDGAVISGPPSLTMTGDALATLPTNGATVSFDYHGSATLKDGVLTQQGWIVVGGAKESYRFSLWAQDSADNRLPLQLVVYGPIEIGPDAGECYATLLGAAPLPADDATFGPATWGKYFVAPYHPLVVQDDGTVSVQSASDARFSHGYFQIEPAGD